MDQIDIRALREKLGTPDKPLSQAELGRRLGGVSQSKVSRLEKGVVRPDGPTTTVLRQLAQTADSGACA